MPTFNLDFVSPERMLFSGQVNSVVAPGSEGEFQVFAGHAPVMTALKPGVVTVDAEDGGRRLYVRGGFAEVTGEAMTILAEHAVDLAELDREKLAAEIKNAAEDVADAKDESAKGKAQKALDGLRALAAAASH